MRVAYDSLITEGPGGTPTIWHAAGLFLKWKLEIQWIVSWVGNDVKFRE